MKVGIHSITWGANLTDVPRFLDWTLCQGFEGVEFAQVPAALGPPRELTAMLRERNLMLAGMSGGSFVERAEYCSGIGAAYLLVHNWPTDGVSGLNTTVMRPTLHPNWFKQIR